MRKITWAMAVFVGVVVISLSFQAIAIADVARITAEELKAKLGDPDVIILDVRRAGDWEASDQKIQGAAREDPEAVQSWAGNYPHEKTFVLYCA
jgi:rhodanese-related sulfurtransferase